MDTGIYVRPGLEGRYKFLFTCAFGHLAGEVSVEGPGKPDTRSKAEKEAEARRRIDILAQDFISAARDQLAA